MNCKWGEEKKKRNRISKDDLKKARYRENLRTETRKRNSSKNGARGSNSEHVQEKGRC